MNFAYAMIYGKTKLIEFNPQGLSVSGVDFDLGVLLARLNFLVLDARTVHHPLLTDTYLCYFQSYSVLPILSTEN